MSRMNKTQQVRLITYTFLLLKKIATLNELYYFINDNYHLGYGVSKNELKAHLFRHSSNYKIYNDKFKNQTYYFLNANDFNKLKGV